jgi:hypothetical protein
MFAAPGAKSVGGPPFYLPQHLEPPALERVEIVARGCSAIGPSKVAWPRYVTTIGDQLIELGGGNADVDRKH